MHTKPNDRTFAYTWEGAGACSEGNNGLPCPVDCAPTYFVNASQLPQEIRGAINQWRKKPKAIVREGTSKGAVSPGDAMKGLFAAAFGNEYMRHAAPALAQVKQ